MCTIKQIPILPDMRCLQNLKETIDNSMGRQTLASRLTHSIALITNESLQVRKMGLDTLLYNIQNERKKFELTILKDAKVCLYFFYIFIVLKKIHSYTYIHTQTQNKIK